MKNITNTYKLITTLLLNLFIQLDNDRSNLFIHVLLDYVLHLL